MYKIVDIWACFDYSKFTILLFDRINRVYLIKNEHSGIQKIFNISDVRIIEGSIQFTNMAYTDKANTKFFEGDN